jgi:DNA invertase Pin-like site-specific DNA recombinase
MFAAASRREFDVVIFWSLDRFSREGTVETLQHLQRLTSYGVAWRIAAELGRSKSDIYRVCQTLGCAGTSFAELAVMP